MNDFNDVVLHFIECAHTNLLTERANTVTLTQGGFGSSIGQLTAPSQTPTHFSHSDATYSTPFPGSTAYQASFPNQTNQVLSLTI